MTTRPALYVYRHIISQQTVFSQSQNLIPKKALAQLPETQRPPRLRKDHWTPICIVSGLDDKATNALYNAVTTQIHPVEPSQEYMTMPKRLRKLHDKDNHVADSISKLCVAFTRMQDQGKSPDVLIHWERPELKYELSEKVGLQWPAFVADAYEPIHLYRGRSIKTPLSPPVNEPIESQTPQ